MSDTDGNARLESWGAALALADEGDLSSAAAICARIVSRDPSSADAWNLLAIAAMEEGRPQDAVGALRKAVAAEPGRREFRENYAELLRSKGESEAALEQLEAVADNDRDVGLVITLSKCCRACGDPKRALATLGTAVLDTPGDHELWTEVCQVLLATGEAARALEAARIARMAGATGAVLDEVEADALISLREYRAAVRCITAALRRGRSDVRALFKYAQAAAAVGRRRAALRSLDAAVEGAARTPAVLALEASVAFALGDWKRSRARYADAIDAVTDMDRKGDAEYRLSLGMHLLGDGDLARGWALYESRLDFGAPRATLERFPECKVWRGEDLSGQTIVVYREQGAGDNIQFVRYLRQLSMTAGEVLFVCPRALRTLFEGADLGSTRLVADDEVVELECDYILPIASLPHRLDPALERVEPMTTYLHYPSVHREEIDRLFEGQSGLKVGIVWQGNRRHGLDHFRSIPLNRLKRLLALDGVAWFSLQYGDERHGLRESREFDRVVDVGGVVEDFADTAAAIEHLDIVVTVDTSVAHLAAALGKETWILLSRICDWRWGNEGERSRWYESVRLFRQRNPCCWEPVVEAVDAALCERLRIARPRSVRVEKAQVPQVDTPRPQSAAKSEVDGNRWDGLERVGIALACEGLGDMLFATPILRKLSRDFPGTKVDLFARRVDVFDACPHVESVAPLSDGALVGYPYPLRRAFGAKGLSYHQMSTMDYMSIPLGLGQLPFRDRTLEYYPTESDEAEYFDIVLNPAQTWPSRTWSTSHWQQVADEFLGAGLSVAIIGRDVRSRDDRMWKRAMKIERCTDLRNRLSLDQTFYTIAKSGVFVSSQGGLSVLAGATDARIVVLGHSIDWSRFALFRRSDPHHRIRYVDGDCELYCCASHVCPLDATHFACAPPVVRVAEAIRAQLKEENDSNPRCAR